MRRMVLAAAMVAGVAGVAMGQVGVKDLVNRQIGGAVQQHNQDLENEMSDQGEQQAQQQAMQAAQQAQAANGPVKTGWIKRKTKDGRTEVRLFFAEPAGLNKAHPAAGMLVVQGEWGVNDEMQEWTKECAQHGFYAVAPDLYYGKTADDAAKAAELKGEMTDPAAMAAMKTGLDLLGEEEQNGVVDVKRVGVVGWGIGGEQAMKLATTDGRIHATAIFYGMPITDWLRLKPIDGPVLGIFGNEDKSPSPKDVDSFVAGLGKAGKNGGMVTIYRYDGVGHGFASKSSGTGYDEAKAKDAFGKMWTWMDTKLKPRG